MLGNGLSVDKFSLFKYTCRTDRRTDRRTDGQTDGRTDRQTRAFIAYCFACFFGICSIYFIYQFKIAYVPEAVWDQAVQQAQSFLYVSSSLRNTARKEGVEHFKHLQYIDMRISKIIYIYVYRYK